MLFCFHCKVSAVPPKKNVKFYLLTCRHIACNNCICICKLYSKNPCKNCLSNPETAPRCPWCTIPVKWFVDVTNPNYLPDNFKLPEVPDVENFIKQHEKAKQEKKGPSWLTEEMQKSALDYSKSVYRAKMGEIDYVALSQDVKKAIEENSMKMKKK